MLGAWWAYRVLGWGGYWGWDPVENSAIMPWLVGTAFIHSIMIQERRGMLKVWNMALVMVTFYLAIFGTFVVRSGVITSVHSFAQSAIGPYFLVFLTLVVASTLGCCSARLPQLRSDNQLDSMLSREASFLLNNLLFLGLVFAIFWGTIFPLVSEAVQGTKITVGPPFFNQVAGPIMIALLVADGHRAADAVAQGQLGTPGAPVRAAGRCRAAGGDRCVGVCSRGSTSRRRSRRSPPAGSWPRPSAPRCSEAPSRAIRRPARPAPGARQPRSAATIGATAATWSIWAS